MGSASFLLTVILLSLGAWPALSNDEETQPLTTTPYQQSLLVGSNATVECHMSVELAANHTAQELTWYYPNGTLIDSWDWHEANFSSTNGTLTGIHLMEADSGEYVCSLPGRLHNASAELRVYAMPSYVSQMTVVYAVDGALLLVFLALGIQSLVVASRGGVGGGVGGVGGGGGGGYIGLRRGSYSNHNNSSSNATTHHTTLSQQQQRHSGRQSRSRDPEREEAEAEAEAETVEVAASSPSVGRPGVKHHRHYSSVPKPTPDDQ